MTDNNLLGEKQYGFRLLTQLQLPSVKPWIIC